MPSVVPGGDVEGHAAQRLEHLVRPEVAQHAAGEQRALQRAELLAPAVAAVELADVANLDRVHRPTLPPPACRAGDRRRSSPRGTLTPRDRQAEDAWPLPEWALAEQHFLVGHDQMGERVERQHALDTFRRLRQRIDDRRGKEPERQQVRQQVPHVAEVHGQRRHEQAPGPASTDTGAR